MATSKIVTQVEHLARARFEAHASVTESDSTYLSLVIDAMQAKLGRKARGRVNAEAHAVVLNEVHELFYAAVLRGVTTDDIAYDEKLDGKEQRRRSLERNSRSAFARTTKSTVANFIAGGGDVRALDAQTVSKAFLRKAVAPPQPADKVARQIANAKGALLRAVERRARGDPDTAREELSTLIEEFQEVLAQLGEGEEEKPAHEATTVVGLRHPPERAAQRTRVGTPLLHRGA